MSQRPQSADALQALIKSVDLGETPDSMRAGFAKIMSGQHPGEPGEIGGVAGLFVGDGRLEALWCHGGGYVFGSPGTHTLAATHIADRLGGRIFLPDYRLAPEHVWPAPLEDVRTIVREIDGPIPVIGDSAGGHLALNLALSQPEQVAGLVLLSPNTDRSGRSSTRKSNTPRDAMNSHAKDDALFRMSCPDCDRDSPETSPLLADVSALPPTWIAVGGDEVLLDDSLLLARALGRANHDVRLRVLPGRSHMFWQWPDLFPDALHALDDAAAFIEQISERNGQLTPCSPWRGTAHPMET